MLFSSLLIMLTITVTNSFSMKITPEKYVHKFMIFNKKSSFVMKHDNNKPCKNHVVKKHQDIFDKFERVSRQGNRIMQEEYLKEIRNYLKKNRDSNNI